MSDNNEITAAAASTTTTHDNTNSNTSDEKAKARARWPALESNPESFTKFIRTLGITANVAIHDVFGFDPELLMMLPMPIYAMIFLFPHDKIPRQQREDLKNPPKDGSGFVSGKEPFFLWQSRALGNACGTIACIHALINNRSSIPIEKDSVLGQYLQACENLTPEQRGQTLENFEPIREKQQKSARDRSTNQTAATDGQVDYHFVCFTEFEGNVIELDGAKNEPVNHGKCTNFGVDCGKIIQQEYMAKMPDEHHFVTLALAPQEG